MYSRTVIKGRRANENKIRKRKRVRIRMKDVDFEYVLLGSPAKELLYL